MSSFINESTPTQGKTRKSRKHKKRGIFHNPGVKKLILSIYTQKLLECEVDEDVTIENPWKLIKKDLFEEDLIRLEDESEFYIYRNELLAYPLEDILVGYINNAASKGDEFYICLTVEAKELIEKHLDDIKAQRDLDIEKCIERYTKTWNNLGSEEDVVAEMNINNRALYEVELIARYPILITSKVQFKLRKVEEARDGYVELLCKVPGTIPKRLISSAVQVRPTTINNVAQTTCTYPKNVWTQYEYDFQIDSDPSAEFKTHMHSYVLNNFDDFNEKLHVNSYINLYQDDYNRLIKDPKYAATPLFIRIKEHSSFTEINICKNKMISSVSWHHFWSGILVASYMDVAQNMYVTEKSQVDEVNRVIYGVNPVLLWSFADALHPRLYLETQREVTTIACCPYDENIVVGGLINGQIIIWDIRNRLNKVEEEEILTPSQAKYRRILFSLIGWMLNIKNVASVSVTAVSDLLYSHKDAVTHIEWLSPYHEVIKTGQIQVLNEKSTHGKSLQFVTSSLDGSILVWDLHSKPVTSGEYRSERRLRRLKKKPSALSVDVSPYRVLNRALRPTYKIDFVHPNNPTIVPITSFQISDITRKYKLINPHIGKYEYERGLFEPEYVTLPLPKMEIIAGTSTGEYVEGYWEGFEYSSSAVLNSEQCKYNKYIKYHDGPLVSVVAFPPNSDVTLTIGGKIFAIWHKTMTERPILWRKSKYRYTHGSWTFRNSHMIRLTRSDGNIELWNILNNSKTSMGEQSLSGRTLVCSHSQPMSTVKPVIGIGDYNGSFRMYIFPTTPLRSEYDEVYLKFTNRLLNEIKRIRNVKQWVEHWKNRNVFIERVKDDLTDAPPKLIIDEIKKTGQEQEKVYKKTREVIPPGEYKQYIFEKWLASEKERMSNVLLSLKQLNPELVKVQQAPLKKLEKEKEMKKKKQRSRVQRSDKIFRENVDMFFPNALHKVPSPPLDPYASVYSKDVKDKCYKNYNNLTEAAQHYVKKNPFRYTFQWSNVIKQGMERRELLDRPYCTSNHRNRYKNQINEDDVIPTLTSIVTLEEEDETEDENET